MRDRAALAEGRSGLRGFGSCCLAGTLATLLLGCGPQTTSQPPNLVPGQSGRPDITPPAQSPALQPLPSPDQVITAVPLGRIDPFANVFPQMRPLSGVGASTGAGAASGPGGGAGRPGATRVSAKPQPLQLPGNFRFSGVIYTGGRSEAVVQYGELGGSLRPGDQGGVSTDLLPRGWSVAAINVQRGELTLQAGGQRITAQL